MRMEHENDIKEALDFVSPSALTYEEWLMVGMGLKEAGLPVTVWEQWSARDGGRYHKGECIKKWESFHGSSKPVTQSSIFQLAYEHGWSGPAGRALDWGDELTVGPQQPVLVDPRWVEEQELHLPDTWEPAQQLKRYLQALFEPDEYVAYVTESFMAADRRRPAKGCWDRTAGQLIEELDACGGDVGKVMGDCDPEIGAWICFNPVDGTGRKDANVTSFRYALVECDNMEPGKQLAAIHQMELPCAALVYSGGKSIHAIVRVNAPDYAEYRKRVDYLYATCQKNGLTLDQQNRNPSRLSRMPGILRAGQKQALLETNVGKSCWEDWCDWVEDCTDDLPDTECLADDWDDLPPLADALISGVLRQGHKMLLAGPSKAGKSFALIELCIAIAEGKTWLGRFSCAQGRVLYINLELDRPSCLHRFKDVYTAMGLAPDNLRNIDIWNLRGASVPMDKLAPKLIRRAGKKGYTAVMRNDVGKKFQCIGFRYLADDEGVISLKNTVTDEGADPAALIPWVVGVAAGTAVNKSATNMVYDGEYTPDTRYTQTQLEAGIQEGSFMLHDVDGETRVLSDINTFVSITDEKGADFSSNQTIRVLDQIANDIAVLFGTKYLGKVPNDGAGRISLWNDIVSHHQKLQAIRALEDFDPEGITVEKGESKKSVAVSDHVTPVNAMEQLYMTVYVN